MAHMPVVQEPYKLLRAQGLVQDPSAEPRRNKLENRAWNSPGLSIRQP